MMNAAFEALGLDATYRFSNVKPSELGSTFDRIRKDQLSGFNVTIPFKSTVIPLLDSLDDVASKIGAVNTVKSEGGSYRGYNTDVGGVVVPLVSRNQRPRRALVLGTGGAARAFCEAMHRMGCGEVVALSRNPRRAEGFLKSTRLAFPEMTIEVVQDENPPPCRPELVFNASPAGGRGIPIPKGLTHVLEGMPTVFDAVYSPIRTGLITEALSHGCPVIYGHEMLLAQGAGALEIWTGRPPPLRVMKQALLESLGVPPA